MIQELFGQTLRVSSTIRWTGRVSVMKVNGDGSVDLCVGPNAPAGLESNWIPTMGKEPYLWLRLCAPEEAFWSKAFKMPDVELVN